MTSHIHSQATHHRLCRLNQSRRTWYSQAASATSQRAWIANNDNTQPPSKIRYRTAATLETVSGAPHCGKP